MARQPKSQFPKIPFLETWLAPPSVRAAVRAAQVNARRLLSLILSVVILQGNVWEVHALHVLPFLLDSSKVLSKGASREF
jgi:hypothetical protein